MWWKSEKFREFAGHRNPLPVPKIQFNYQPDPIKIEFSIMSGMVANAERYDKHGFIDLRDKQLTMLRVFIESIKGKQLLEPVLPAKDEER